MFQFPALAPHMWWYTFSISGYPIRKSAHQRIFAPKRGLSQLITSFIASESQGIHRMPLITFAIYTCSNSITLIKAVAVNILMSLRSTLCFACTICQWTMFHQFWILNFESWIFGGELLMIGLRLSLNSHFVENNGFEPLTPCLQSRCSSQLS